MIPVEKPGTPGELVHHGIKGMRWGVRNVESSSAAGPKRKKASTAKKVAVGATALTMAAGAGFVAFKLSQTGHVPVSSIKTTGDTIARARSMADAAGGTEAARYAEMFLKEALG